MRSPYSPNCTINPRFGSAIGLFLLTNPTLSLTLQPYLHIRYPQTTLALLLMPCTQCTNTFACGLDSNAVWMKAVLEGRMAASSAKGRSSRGIWVCVMCGIGRRSTKPRMMDRTCVIPRLASSCGFSGRPRSDMYNLGTVSEYVEEVG